ncbi:hypothetical protein, unlikely [Trypanosoma brucei gambiense DAL972]|uniref:Uncharacterized protein n=3 Tax=Trypanosoma brucei TaxID=5691 RepID=Q4GYF7_TRYB2|nr:hypothetical protein, unlikely [Trypanosoma brucei brucei TREU927]XP_011771553.1 hypothetical protein, unlikely [Trypanosoma brucei gambiense DAL972]RHW74310.1 hypothetical protein DPX39_010041700 [Trypanosoma brucei equiperdum]CAJ16627.1 hypothetical protein, unlikely [Trypanosoma brucei brucei TREU927]CBH09112.1 hypothetical protein, unlikely [Trypanosoma brucei gambiense DAL972]|eukprot:XP_011771553.1 hypothetical protein, unlikely [Trypanosoma brucei gambiense DAL972]
MRKRNVGIKARPQGAVILSNQRLCLVDATKKGGKHLWAFITVSVLRAALFHIFFFLFSH